MSLWTSPITLNLQPYIMWPFSWLCQKYSIKYIYSTSQMSKLSLTLCTFSVTGSVAGLFLTLRSTYVIYTIWYYPFKSFYFLLLLPHNLWPLLWLVTCDSDVMLTLTPIPRIEDERKEKKIKSKEKSKETWV